ncbi:hypothetical protein GGR62_003523 [Xanthomonas campestris]|nr:hypothetical protein [Xanthomonas sp. 3075]
MPKISFAAHISSREAIERRRTRPRLPSAARPDTPHLPQGGNTHAMHAKVDDDDRNLPANCTRLGCISRRCSQAFGMPCRAPRASGRRLARLRTFPDLADHLVADGRSFALSRVTR